MEREDLYVVIGFDHSSEIHIIVKCEKCGDVHAWLHFDRVPDQKTMDSAAAKVLGMHEAVHD